MVSVYTIVHIRIDLARLFFIYINWMPYSVKNLFLKTTLKNKMLPATPSMVWHSDKSQKENFLVSRAEWHLYQTRRWYDKCKIFEREKNECWFYFPVLSRVTMKDRARVMHVNFSCRHSSYEYNSFFSVQFHGKIKIRLPTLESFVMPHSSKQTLLRPSYLPRRLTSKFSMRWLRRRRSYRHAIASRPHDVLVG